MNRTSASSSANSSPLLSALDPLLYSPSSCFCLYPQIS
jgi:hypothetical protein